MKPCDINADACVKELLDYLYSLPQKGVLLGQHTQTKVQKELRYIKEITGKEPAICGFELLSYSPNIQYETCGEECLKEIEENRGTLEQAMEWADKGGIVTFCWHWFSPMGGRDKSFYSENTEFDASKAIIEGTPEQKALYADMDEMAKVLRPFSERKIPILFRPFHEADGKWFWWGAKGVKTAAQLYRQMFIHFTQKHHLHNIIWIWNAPIAEEYPGDDVVDVVSLDIYPPAHQHSGLREEYDKLYNVSNQKLTAIGEIGPHPSVPEMEKINNPLAWYMIWSNDFGCSEKFTTNKVLKMNYDCSYAVSFEKLPDFSWKCENK